MYTFAVATNVSCTRAPCIYVRSDTNLLVNYIGTVFIEFHFVHYLRDS